MMRSEASTFTLERAATIPLRRWATLAVALAGWANFSVIWNEFYRRTPQLFDTGWYAHLVYRNSPLLENPPPVVFATIGPLFYSTHFSPGLWLLSLPSYLLPVGPQVWLGLLEAAKYGLVAVVVWLAVRALLNADHRPAGGASGAAIFAPTILLLAPFNGVLLASSAYPHFESWFIPAALAFFLALFRRHYAWAVPPFLAALTIREDMGFHLAGILLIAILAAVWQVRRWESRFKAWILFTAAALTWSCGAILLMKVVFPGEDDAFRRVYVGDPPFAHLTWSRVQWQLGVLFERAGFLWLPLLTYGAWATLSRSWWVLIGYLAFLPWFALNVSARSLAPATLGLYYSFPYAIALLWPLVGWFAFARERDRVGRALGWVSAAIALSIVGYVRGHDFSALMRNMSAPALAGKVGRDAALRHVLAAQQRGTPMLVDSCFSALAPHRFTADQLIGLGSTPAELVVFFRTSPQADVAWFTARPLSHWYRLAGTPIIVASAAPLDWPEAEELSARAGSLRAFLNGPAVGRSWSASSDSPSSQIAARGPKWYCHPPGPWRATFALQASTDAGAGDSAIRCEVVMDNGNTVLASIEIPAMEFSTAPRRIERVVEFHAPLLQPAGIQVRVSAPRASFVRVDDISLLPVPSSRTQPMPRCRRKYPPQTGSNGRGAGRKGAPHAWRGTINGSNHARHDY
jgi:uncharacterized membrane protein